MTRRRPPFDPRLERRELTAGLIFLPLHFILLPLAADALALRFPQLGIGQMNLLYYAVGILFLLLFFLPFLRRQFDALCDAPMLAFHALAGGYLIELAAAWGVVALFSLLGLDADANPNNETILALTGRDWGIIKALAIFMAPLLEETLVRGVVFGALRPRHRIAAYAVSVALFALCHVWQYALAARDVSLLLFALQYVPQGLALAWCYDISGTLWSPIALHTLINALAYASLGV